MIQPHVSGGILPPQNCLELHESRGSHMMRSHNFICSRQETSTADSSHHTKKRKLQIMHRRMHLIGFLVQDRLDRQLVLLPDNGSILQPPSPTFSRAPCGLTSLERICYGMFRSHNRSFLSSEFEFGLGAESCCVSDVSILLQGLLVLPAEAMDHLSYFL